MPKYTEANFNRQVNYLNETKNLMKEAIINKGQTITNNTPFREYADKIINIRGGGSFSGNAYRFPNNEAMYSYKGANIGDYAAIYDINNSYFNGIYKYEDNQLIEGVSLINSFKATAPYYNKSNDYVKTSELEFIRSMVLQEIDEDDINNYNYILEKIQDNEFNLYMLKIDGSISIEYEGETYIIPIKTGTSAGAKYFIDPDNDDNHYYIRYLFNNLMTSNNSGLSNSTIIDMLSQEEKDQCIEEGLTFKKLNIKDGSYTKEDITDFAFLNGTSVYFKGVDFNNKNICSIVLDNINKNYTVGYYVYLNKYVSGNVNSIGSFFVNDLVKRSPAFIPVEVPFNTDKYKVINGIFYGKNGIEEGNLFSEINYEQNTISELGKRLNAYRDLSNVINTPIENSSLYLHFGHDTDMIVAPYLNTLNVINTASMFFNCQNLRSVPSYNTSNVTNMSQMFFGCNNLRVAPWLNTAKVTNMASMFGGYNISSSSVFNLHMACENLITVPNYNTSNVTNMASMFSIAKNIKILPLFNTAKVTSMAYMFNSCISLINVPVYNTAGVTTMAYMFSLCNNLQTSPSFTTSAVNNMSGMFNGCINLKTIASYTTNTVTNMASMFSNCYNITSVPNFNMLKVNNAAYMFANCTNLTLIRGMKMLATANNICNMFLNCNNLTDASYHNIASMLPNASGLSNKYISNIGLDPERFTEADKYILADKEYVDIVIPGAEKYIISYE